MGGEEGKKKRNSLFLYFFSLPHPSFRLSRRLVMSILLECSFKREFYCKQREVKELSGESKHFENARETITVDENENSHRM